MATHAHSTPAPARRPLRATVAQRPADPLASIDRQRLETAVEKLITVLDALDGDTDAEPSEEEVSLGWSENASQLRLGKGDQDGDNTAPERAGAGFAPCSRDDHEEGGDAEPDDDAEPTLGALDAVEDQTESWTAITCLCAESEPSLGWPEYVGSRAGRLTEAGMYAQMLGGEDEDNRALAAAEQGEPEDHL